MTGTTSDPSTGLVLRQGDPIGVIVDGKPRIGFPTPSRKQELFSETLREWGWPMIDAQLSSAHLRTLGAVVMRRAAFVRAVETLIEAQGRPGPWQEAVGARPVRALAASD